MVKLFAEREAWALFKYTAIGEAAGWVLLLYGLAAQQWHWAGASFMLPIGGSVHGLLFLAYLGAVAAGFTSLEWSWRRGLFAICMSVVPFATLGFEQWTALSRQRGLRGALRRVVVRLIIADGQRLLALQPGTGLSWELPGGEVRSGESPEQAAGRLAVAIGGVGAKVSGLRAVVERPDTRAGTAESTLEFYFKLECVRLDPATVVARMQKIAVTDEARYLDPQNEPALEPGWLRHGSVSALLRTDDASGVAFF